MPLTQDTGVIEPNQLLIKVFIAQFNVLLKGIESLDKVIEQAYKAQQDKVMFDSLPKGWYGFKKDDQSKAQGIFWVEPSGGMGALAPFLNSTRAGWAPSNTMCAHEAVLRVVLVPAYFPDHVGTLAILFRTKWQ